MTVPTDSLPDDPGTLKAMLLAERTCAGRLEQIIKEMQRHRLGRLRPVHERLLAILKGSTKLFADETTAPVLDPGRNVSMTLKHLLS
jgi:transposase